MKGQVLFFSALALILLISGSMATVASSWVNQDVVRSIDLTSQLSKSTIQIKARALKESSVYQLAIDSSYHSSIQVFDEDSRLPLLVKFDSISHKKVKSEGVLNLKVIVTLMGQMKPYPEHITQTQGQLVKYTDNHYFSTPYKTESQKTTVKLATAKVESASELSPSSVKGNTVSYGPYKNIEAFTVSAMSIHFENNAPFLVITSLIKEYEVSHWGNLAVETHYDVQHKGAALKGAFSRLDFQRQPSPAHIAEIQEIVPKSAADFYYRDSIGNISTSSYTHHPNHLTLKIVPRFPLMGGWKNSFYAGFNLPVGQFLSVDSDTGSYVLNVTFGVGIDNIYVESHTVKFILPEGATDIKVTAPFDVKMSQENRKTYLDTVGRPVLVLHLDHTAAENYQYIQVSYNLSSMAMFHEPLLLIGAVFALCVLIMIYVRFELSISKNNIVVDKKTN
ncbi:hypothetical protein CYY_007578 [Polysphondylium violaceum]|uniref:Dolichyl-diphosphooligosaccharide--protein glycosyltransferase subunit 1 n=1 Tax=Polysphondylium violaceum TaxID=133409 RepID=A0A8J4UXY2_9MYCE|nr:hypothetical protein CYY_007578 [Polysphondylium violaceum]